MIKKRIINTILILLAIFITISFYLRIETFEIVPTIDFYVITMGKPDRENNIKLQIEQQINIMFQNPNENDRFNFDIKRIDAVVGKNIDLDHYVNQKRVFNDIYNNTQGRFHSSIESRKNEIGCYLSHYKTYETIRDNGNPMGYSVIFEDDFVLNPDFLSTLDDTMIKLKNSDIDFDMLFLGIWGSVGENVLNNIYKPTGISWCTHGYLINNKHINKIIEKLWFIDDAIDNKIFKKEKENELIVYRLEPTIVQQSGDQSQIR
jgi:GR25 family glycosyltransferase involved in LPS biosynthesis